MRFSCTAGAMLSARGDDGGAASRRPRGSFGAVLRRRSGLGRGGLALAAGLGLGGLALEAGLVGGRRRGLGLGLVAVLGTEVRPGAAGGERGQRPAGALELRELGAVDRRLPGAGLGDRENRRDDEAVVLPAALRDP